ncbi:MAG: hypothetical protein JWO67_4702 [Streptosporangiaceae bacterium]|nr:hypothetical protein [Streptosporangiaceae bacterium]
MHRVMAVVLLLVAIAATIMLLIVMPQPEVLGGHGVLLVFTGMVVAPLAALLSGKAFSRARELQVAREQAPALREAAQAWWTEGERMMSRLSRDDPPAPLTVWGLVLHPGEQAHLQLPLTYSRYYGHDVTYSGGGGFYVGPPGVILAAAVGNLIGEAAAASRAREAAAPRWRDHQVSTVILTNRRLICQVEDRWASFHYSGVTAVYPDLANRGVVLQLADTVPLRLHGLGAPSAMVYLCWALHGAAKLRHHPALQPLRVGPPWPLESTDRDEGRHR